MTKMKHEWEVKVSDQMRDLLGNARAARKRSVWSPNMFQELMMKYWESPEYKAFCEWNKRNKNEGVGKRVVREQGSTEARLLCRMVMATVSCGLDCGRLYGADSEVAHLKVESSRAVATLPPSCLEAKQRIMRQVKASVSSVCLPSTST
ncbi:hypothetical protein M9H77_09415 [Catharanthus roseus]|uniref:Uncharacterized protein n=1 Tax=Catharanthus roseus TaxID=4058 RepID=A0ACC0C0P9_CATRO|nr:hypothetical protein M9H77_09415 [Catharanthus roseus]